MPSKITTIETITNKEEIVAHMRSLSTSNKENENKRFNVYERKAVLFFTGEFCVKCQEIKKELDDYNGPALDLIIIDVQEDACLKEEYAIRSLPHFILVDDEGGVIRERRCNDLEDFERFVKE